MTAVYLIFLLSPSWQHCHFRCPRTKQVKPKTIRAGIFLFRAIWNYLITWTIPLIHARAGDPFYPSSEEYTTPFLSLFFLSLPPHPPVSLMDLYWLIHILYFIILFVTQYPRVPMFIHSTSISLIIYRWALQRQYGQTWGLSMKPKE